MTRLAADGVTSSETGRRFHRSSRYVEQVLRLATVPRHDAAPVIDPVALRPLERRLLRWRAEGLEPSVVAPMFRRSPEHIERVLALVDYKRSRSE